jgi:hypothetical protein
VGKPRVAVVHRETVPGTPANYDVSAVRVVYGMLKEAVDCVGGMRSVIDDGDKVVVRANSCWAAQPDSGIAGDPRLVEALLRLIRDETNPSEVVVADRSSIGANTAEAFEVNGVGAAALRGGADRILALEQDQRVMVPIPDPLVLLRPVALARTMLEADKLIYVPKMKVHSGSSGLAGPQPAQVLRVRRRRLCRAVSGAGCVSARLCIDEYAFHPVPGQDLRGGCGAVSPTPAAKGEHRGVCVS